MHVRCHGTGYIFSTMGIELRSLACNSCGASLTVTDATRFVTCAHCGSQLAVHRTDNSAFTEIVSEIREQNLQIAEDLRVVRLQNDVEALDRDWEIQREAYISTKENGEKTEPHPASNLAGGVLAVVLAVVWLVGTSMPDGPQWYSLIGPVIGLLGILNAVSGYHRSHEFARLKDRYQKRREQLLKKKAEFD